ncbi:MAG: hypothetical protein VYB93_05760 [Pseudomonadota bacterium]|nr:hypothetical protein [Pseudomonadota bacterium]
MTPKEKTAQALARVDGYDNINKSGKFTSTPTRGKYPAAGTKAALVLAMLIEGHRLTDRIAGDRIVADLRRRGWRIAERQGVFAMDPRGAWDAMTADRFTKRVQAHERRKLRAERGQ